MKSKIALSSLFAGRVGRRRPRRSAQIEIQWWHSMGGALGDWVNDLAKEFNASQKDYKVVPTYKGSYDESMTAAIAAFRAGNAPHILQVFEVGTATMMAARARSCRWRQVMKDAGEKFDPNDLRAGGGRLLHRAQRPDAVHPFNSSTHGLLLQQGRLQEGRPRPRQAAETWPEVALAAAKLKASGAQVPVHHRLAVAGPSSRASRAWHNVEFATKQQRLRRPRHAAGRSTRRCTCATSRTWPTWPSRACSSTRAAATTPTRTFVSGECAMITASSALYGNIKKNAKFDFGIAPLPYYPDVPGAPQNTVIGGASLWVMSRQEARRVQGRRRRSSTSCRSPRCSREPPAHRLPADHDCAAYELTEKSGFYKENPGTDVA